MNFVELISFSGVLVGFVAAFWGLSCLKQWLLRLSARLSDAHLERYGR